MLLLHPRPGVSAARVTARRSTRPVPREPWGRPACGPPSTRAGRGRAARPRPTRARAGRAAVRSRHHNSGTRSTGPRRRSRGRTCTRTSRSSRRSRWARAGGCSSRTWVGVRACSHYASERSRTDRPGGSTRDRPGPCAIERANVGWRGTKEIRSFQGHDHQREHSRRI